MTALEIIDEEIGEMQNELLAFEHRGDESSAILAAGMIEMVIKIRKRIVNEVG